MSSTVSNSKKYLKFFFTAVPFISAGISTIHLLNFFDLGNENWLSIMLSIAFEIGSISSFLMMSEFKSRHTFLKWFIFLVLFFMQILGNVYYSFEYINISLASNKNFLDSFTELSNVFVLLFREEALSISGAKFLLACLIGLPIPVISLAFLKARMNLELIENESNQIVNSALAVNNVKASSEFIVENTVFKDNSRSKIQAEPNLNFIQLKQEPIVDNNNINNILPVKTDSKEFKILDIINSSDEPKVVEVKKQKKPRKKSIKSKKNIELDTADEEANKLVELTTVQLPKIKKNKVKKNIIIEQKPINNEFHAPHINNH